MLALFQRFGWGEIIVILAVLLVFFGANRLPELARSLGSSAKEFRKGLEGDDDDEDNDDAKDQPTDS